MEFLQHYLGHDLAFAIWHLIKAVLTIVPLTLSVAYLTLAERRILAFMHARIGANRVGPFGLFQPFADLFKFVFKEIIVPYKASRGVFYFSPIIILFCALSCWAVIPFNPELYFTDVNAGLLYVVAVSSLGVYGIILAGWAGNSKYSFLGGVRATAQMISYELAMGFALIAVIMVSGSLNFIDIVNSQAYGKFAGSILSWNLIPLFPMFLVYLISGVAETNRAPFDVCEGESEIVAGFHVEYSGTPFALFMLAEYANMFLVSTLTVIMFLGGWLSPFPRNWGILGHESMAWLVIKVLILLFGFIWYRATFPRYRYDQIMRLGWKIFLPITLVWIFVIAVWMVSPFTIWK
ncbi:NADH-quinone oxidoreductase subunit NuoH [Aquella oligotrophica]|uniref:NADH-quinone oxidoreductase subunit H n=1 Tax=Aquella oligotrophica TaxID=2067065 RepID=A0A2I7N4N2_9NEIS|nr:NADH-quinone oxidoreductase subunit NuoH [Aquella oligotrophica]AUR51388.1 NADH-quinone oxidoreductase subunit NuoH [Aquella oligotrophica]